MAVDFDADHETQVEQMIGDLVADGQVPRSLEIMRDAFVRSLRDGTNPLLARPILLEFIARGETASGGAVIFTPEG